MVFESDSGTRLAMGSGRGHGRGQWILDHGRLVSLALIVAVVDVVYPPVTLAIATAIVGISFVDRGLAVRLAVVLLIMSTDILGPLADSASTVGLYRPILGPASAALLLAAWSTIVVLDKASAEGRAWNALPWRRLVLMAFVVTLGLAGSIEYGRDVSAMLTDIAPWLWIGMGLVIGRVVDVRHAILSGLIVKAVQISIMALLGIGYRAGDLVRPSFDSYWLAAPIAFAFFLTTRRVSTSLRVVALSSILVASAYSVTRQAWLALALTLPLLATQAKSIGYRRTVGILAAAAVISAGVVAWVATLPGSVALEARLVSIPSVLLKSADESADLRWLEVVDIRHEVGGNAVWGLGFGGTFSLSHVAAPPLDTNAYPEAELQSGEFTKAHVPIATTYLKTGLIGVTVWLYVLFWPWVKRIGGQLGSSATHGEVQTALLAGSPLLLAGPWTPKLALLAGLSAISIATAQR